MRVLKSRLFLIGFVVLFLAVSIIIATPKQSIAASWEQVGASGLGGGVNNSTAVRLVSFNDALYASIGNSTTGVQIFRSTDGIVWTQVNTSGFGSVTNIDAVMIVHDSVLYAGTVAFGGQTQLWKTTNGTIWTQVGTDGLGDIANIGIVGMGEFNGNLYIGVDNVLTGAEVFRVDNATTLTQVNVDGFDGNTIQIWALKEYEGALYAGTTSVGGAQIWKTTNGTSWSKIMDGGFGDVNNSRINALFNFGGELYAGTLNTTTGTEIWRTTSSDSVWEQVNTDGFGDALTIWAGDQVAIVNGVIYLGTRNDTNGARLFTSSNGSTWIQEGTDGFGDPTNNFAIYAVTFNGRIYLGISSATGAEIWRTGSMSTLTIDTTALADETVGNPVRVTLATSAGTVPLTWSITSGSLPDGQSLDSLTGTISGTPTRVGTYTFTVRVTDTGSPQQIATRALTINVIAVLPETGGGGYLDLADNLF